MGAVVSVYRINPEADGWLPRQHLILDRRCLARDLCDYSMALGLEAFLYPAFPLLSLSSEKAAGKSTISSQFVYTVYP